MKFKENLAIISDRLLDFLKMSGIAVLFFIVAFVVIVLLAYLVGNKPSWLYVGGLWIMFIAGYFAGKESGKRKR